MHAMFLPLVSGELKLHRRSSDRFGGTYTPGAGGGGGGKPIASSTVESSRYTRCFLCAAQ
jgi:hypothetical protein